MRRNLGWISGHVVVSLFGFMRGPIYIIYYIHTNIYIYIHMDIYIYMCVYRHFSGCLKADLGTSEGVKSSTKF